MDTNPKRKLAILMLGATAITGIGVAATGIAAAQSSTPNTPAVTQQQTGPETNAPDSPNSAETPETNAPESPNSAETPSKESPADASLPGGGHADPVGQVGQNVDHQFNGVE